jgi:hypothetical protein
VTTWVFAYFSADDRRRFVELLEAESHHLTIAWVSAGGRGTVAAFADVVVPEQLADADVLGAGIFEGGSARWEMLAFVQEHGAWIDWRAGASEHALR